MGEFSNMRKLMRNMFKGVDFDELKNNPQARIKSPQEQKMEARKERKQKPTRGGGGGFGAA